jgi:hypothetical protein
MVRLRRLGCKLNNMKKLLFLLLLVGFGASAQTNLGNFNNLRVNNLTGIMQANGTSNVSTVTDGTAGQALTTNGSGVYSFSTVTTAPGGSTGDFQYNNAGVFGGYNASAARTALGGTTIGQNVFLSTNPGAIRFGRANADNTFDWLSASDFRTAIGAGTVTGTGTANQVSYWNGTNSQTGSSNFTFDGSTLSVAALNTSGGIGFGSTGAAINASSVRITFNKPITPSTDGGQDLGDSSGPAFWGSLRIRGTAIKQNTMTNGEELFFASFGANNASPTGSSGQISYTYNSSSADNGYVAITGKSGGLPWKLFGTGFLTTNDMVVGSVSSGTTDGFLFSNDGGMFASRTSFPILNLRRQSSDGEIAVFFRNTTQVGNISVTTTATAYNTSSDYRLKDDFRDFSGIDLISRIKIYDYAWKVDNSRSYGVKAHELQEVFPQAVSGEKDAVDENGNIQSQGVDYSKLVPILTKSIQEQQTQIEILTKRIEALEKK